MARIFMLDSREERSEQIKTEKTLNIKDQDKNKLNSKVITPGIGRCKAGRVLLVYLVNSGGRFRSCGAGIGPGRRGSTEGDLPHIKPLF